MSPRLPATLRYELVPGPNQSALRELGTSSETSNHSSIHGTELRVQHFANELVVNSNNQDELGKGHPPLSARTPYRTGRDSSLYGHALAVNVTMVESSTRGKTNSLKIVLQQTWLPCASRSRQATPQVIENILDKKADSQTRGLISAFDASLLALIQRP